MADRREFLRKLVKGAAYAAPAIYTLSTPRDLSAIVTSGMIMWSESQQAPAQTEGPEAPWSVPPQTTSPWAEPAPWDKPPSGGTSSPPGTSGSNEQ